MRNVWFAGMAGATVLGVPSRIGRYSKPLGGPADRVRRGWAAIACFGAVLAACGDEDRPGSRDPASMNSPQAAGDDGAGSSSTSNPQVVPTTDAEGPPRAFLVTTGLPAATVEQLVEADDDGLRLTRLSRVQIAITPVATPAPTAPTDTTSPPAPQPAVDVDAGAAPDAGGAPDAGLVDAPATTRADAGLVDAGGDDVPPPPEAPPAVTPPADPPLVEPAPQAAPPVPTRYFTEWFVFVENVGEQVRCLPQVRLRALGGDGSVLSEQELLVFADTYVSTDFNQTLVCVPPGGKGLAYTNSFEDAATEATAFARVELTTGSLSIRAAGPDPSPPELSGVTVTSSAAGPGAISGFLGSGPRGVSNPSVDFFVLDEAGYANEYLSAVGIGLTLRPPSGWVFFTRESRQPIVAHESFLNYELPGAALRLGPNTPDMAMSSAADSGAALAAASRDRRDRLVSLRANRASAALESLRETR